MFSVIVSLKPGSCCWLNFCPSKSEKLNRATNCFHWIYGYEIVVTDDHFKNQQEGLLPLYLTGVECAIGHVDMLMPKVIKCQIG